MQAAASVSYLSHRQPRIRTTCCNCYLRLADHLFALPSHRFHEIPYYVESSASKVTEITGREM